MIERMLASGVIVVIRRQDPDKVEQIAAALIEGGVSALEITVDSPRAFELIESIKYTFHDRVVVGAGTVITKQEAEAALDAGAEFVFSPHFDEEVVKTTRSRGKISIPGVLTPTEIVRAHQCGADMVKVFPASVVGAHYVKELQAPLGHIKMIPTGGINSDNVAEYIRNGAAAVGIGSSLMKREVIQSGQFERLTDYARNLVTKIRHAREEK